MICICDFIEHEHEGGLCRKEVRFDNSMNFRKCSKHVIKTIVDDKVENVRNEDCLCPSNRCCMSCWEVEAELAKKQMKKKVESFGI